METAAWNGKGSINSCLHCAKDKDQPRSQGLFPGLGAGRERGWTRTFLRARKLNRVSSNPFSLAAS